MDISVPYPYNNFNAGCMLSDTHHKSTSEKGASLLSLINASSIPLSRELEARGLASASSTLRSDDWRIIAPPNNNCSKLASFEKQHDLKETRTMSTIPSETWNSPISHRALLQSSNNEHPLVTPDSVAKSSLRAKFPPLMEVVIGQGDEVQTRIAGIVYMFDQSSDDESVLSDMSWED